MNLLPPRVIRKKSRRSLLMLLAAVQVAIFLVVGAAAVTVTRWEQQARIRSDELAVRLVAFSPTHADTAAMLHTARARADQLEAFIRGVAPVPFDNRWLKEILYTIPHGASLARLDYRDGELLLTGEVSDLSLVEVHRAAMAGVFEGVRSHCGKYFSSHAIYSGMGGIFASMVLPRWN